MGSDILLSFRYQYDGNGNRLTKTGIQGSATDGSSALDITYQHDVRGQLLEENRKDAVFRYSYDAAGNRIRKEEAGENRNIETVYFYNEKNQLIHTEELLSDGILRRNTFTYSKQGSILREETESGISRYLYNGKNQQIRVERADGQIQENRYDAEGLRHEMRENGKLLGFVYQNGELLYEEGGDKETASCHLGAGIEAVRRGQRTYYYHPDEQLSTALITDETVTIKNQYRYDAFGAGLEVSEELPNRIRYTGQQYDGVTEQYYLRARYYNPMLGRFLQEDVYQGDGLNLYAYCRNNPVVYCDPSGYGSSFFFRGDDDYKKRNSIGVPIGDGVDIVSFDVHVNNKETTSGSNIYISFSEELKSVLRFTKDGKVIKVKISDSKEKVMLGQESYTAWEAGAVLLTLGFSIVLQKAMSISCPDRSEKSKRGKKENIPYRIF